MNEETGPKDDAVYLRVEGIHLAKADNTEERAAALKDFAARLQTTAETMVREGRSVNMHVMGDMGAVLTGRLEGPSPALLLAAAAAAARRQQQEEPHEGPAIHAYTADIIQRFLLEAHTVPDVGDPAERKERLAKMLQAISQGMPIDMLKTAAEDITKILEAKKQREMPEVPDDALLAAARDMLVAQATNACN